LRWPATAAALTYTGVLLTLHFIFPLFPAEPKLAPVLFDVERMVPPQFPLLLIVPAAAIDLVLRRFRNERRSWLVAAALSLAFLLTFIAVQWPAADFLQSDLARNAIFKQNVRPYMIPANSYGVLGNFYDPASGVALVTGLGIALGLGVMSARMGMGIGRWMAGVRR
jgi:hypothetical protein